MQIEEVLVSMPDGSKQPFKVLEGYPLKHNSPVKGEFTTGALKGQKRILPVGEVGNNLEIEPDKQTEILIAAAYAQMKTTGKQRVNVNQLVKTTGVSIYKIKKALESASIPVAQNQKHTRIIEKTKVVVSDSGYVDAWDAAFTIKNLGQEQRQVVLDFIKLSKDNSDIYKAVKTIQNLTSEQQQKVVGVLEK